MRLHSEAKGKLLELEILKFINYRFIQLGEVVTSRLNFVVISHVHGDHTSGLKLVASIKPGLNMSEHL